MLKRLSSLKIAYTLCLVNESNFPITHTMMFVILIVSVKWCLYDGIPFNKIPMGWLVMSKTFSTICVLFWTCFAWKKMQNIVVTTVQVIGLNAVPKVLKDLNLSVAVSIFAPSTSTWSAGAFLLLKRSYLGSHNNIFQTFSCTKHSYRNPLQNLSIFLIRW